MSQSICLNRNCGRPYTPITTWQKYCCDRCRREGWLHRKVEALLKELKKENEAKEKPV
jgi:hypothetical protein